MASGPAPLTGILAVQAVLSLRLVWSNTAFTDEALYLWAGHLEWAHWLHGAPIPGFATYFSGAPVIYPPLGAAADTLGGLAAARILSLLFMLTATVLLWGTTTRLFGRKSAAFACALFVAIGPTADLGAFATYDAMAVFLLALATWLAVRAQGPRREAWLAAAALVMVLADATKYASALWDPVIIALAALGAGSGAADAVGRAVRMLSYAAVAAVCTLVLIGGRQYVQGLFATTVTRGDSSTSPVTVLWTAATYLGLLLILAGAGVIASRHAGTRNRCLCGVLFAAILLAPLHQAQIHTLTSLYKHVVFGAWFGVMAAGYALRHVTAMNPHKAWRAGAVVICFAAFIGLGQSAGRYTFWPKSGRLVAATAAALPADGTALLESSDTFVIDYYLHRDTWDQKLISDLSIPQRYLPGMVDSGSFAVIETEVPAPSSADYLVRQRVRASHRYHLVTTIRWDAGGNHGKAQIWARSAP